MKTAVTSLVYHLNVGMLRPEHDGLWHVVHAATQHHRFDGLAGCSSVDSELDRLDGVLNGNTIVVIVSLRVHVKGQYFWFLRVCILLLGGGVVLQLDGAGWIVQVQRIPEGIELVHPWDQLLAVLVAIGRAGRCA